MPIMIGEEIISKDSEKKAGKKEEITPSVNKEKFEDAVSQFLDVFKVKNKEPFLFKEGEVVYHKLQEKKYLVHENKKPSLAFKHKRVMVKDSDGLKYLFLEHELERREQEKETIKKGLSRPSLD